MGSSVSMVKSSEFQGIKGQFDFEILQQSLGQPVDMSFLENQKKDVLSNLEDVEKKIRRITKLRELTEKGMLANVMALEFLGQKDGVVTCKKFLDDNWSGFSSQWEALVSWKKELSKKRDQLNKTIEANLELGKKISEYEEEFGAIDNLELKDLF